MPTSQNCPLLSPQVIHSFQLAHTEMHEAQKRPESFRSTLGELLCHLQIHVWTGGSSTACSNPFVPPFAHVHVGPCGPHGES